MVTGPALWPGPRCDCSWSEVQGAAACMPGSPPTTLLVASAASGVIVLLVSLQNLGLARPSGRPVPWVQQTPGPSLPSAGLISSQVRCVTLAESSLLSEAVQHPRGALWAAAFLPGVWQDSTPPEP